MDIIDEVRTCASDDRLLEVGQEARDHAGELPLSHRIGRVDRFAELLLNRTELILTPGPSKPERVRNGTDGCVFLWVGASAYLQPALVLFLDPAFDEALTGMLVAPWDTGGVVGMGSVGHRVTDEAAALLVDRYSLPVPEYRELLAEVLGRCFSAPADYWMGGLPTRCYPGRSGIPFDKQHFSEDRLPAQTFEGRVPGAIQVEPDVIGIAYDPTALDRLGMDASRIIAKLEKRMNGRILHRRTLEQSMRDTVISVVRRILEDRGVL